MLMIRTLTLATILSLTLVAYGCGGSDNSNGGGTQGGKACATSIDCEGGAICVAAGANAASVCTLTCSVNANECGGSAQCGGVGALSVNICQEEKKPEEQKAESQPVVPCKTDADCAAIQQGTICATWKGRSECTIPCSVEQDCSPPTFAGVSLDFLTCGPDETEGQSRTACVPDEKCMAEPQCCMELGGAPNPLGSCSGGDGGGLDGGFGIDAGDGSSDDAADGADFGADAGDFGDFG